MRHLVPAPARAEGARRRCHLHHSNEAPPKEDPEDGAATRHWRAAKDLAALTPRSHKLHAAARNYRHTAANVASLDVGDIVRKSPLVPPIELANSQNDEPSSVKFLE